MQDYRSNDRHRLEKKSSYFSRVLQLVTEEKCNAFYSNICIRIVNDAEAERRTDDAWAQRQTEYAAAKCGDAPGRLD